MLIMSLILSYIIFQHDVNYKKDKNEEKENNIGGENYDSRKCS